MGIFKKEFKKLEDKKSFKEWFSGGYTDTDIKKYWTYACLNIRAKGVAKSDYFFTENDKKVNEKHWSNQLLKSPHINYSWYDLMYYTAMALDLKGNAYILPQVERVSGRDVVVSMLALPPNRVTVYGENEMISHYHLRLQNTSVNFQPDELIHIKDLTPSVVESENFYQGSPHLINAIKDVHEIAIKRLDFIEKYFQRDGTPPYMLGTEQDVDFREAEQFWDMYNEQMGNPDYKALSFLPKGIKPFQLSESSSTYASVVGAEDSQSLRKAIGGVMGVPDVLLTAEYKTRATAGDIITFFLEDTIDPQNKKIVAAINSFLERFNIKLNYTLKTFRNEEFSFRKTSTMFRDGAISRDEYREENGFEAEGMVIIPEKKTSNQILNTGTHEKR